MFWVCVLFGAAVVAFFAYETWAIERIQRRGRQLAEDVRWLAAWEAEFEALLRKQAPYNEVARKLLAERAGE